MKGLSHIREQRGIALVVALMVMVLFIALGAAAMMMSQLGYMAISSEKRYQIANWAAEYGLNKGLESLLPSSVNPICSTGGSGSATSGSNYSYFGAGIGGNFCYIHSTGTQGNAKVVKTVLVPRNPTAQHGALVLRNGGSIDMGGSSSIVNCDTTCKTPGVVYGTGLNLNINSISDDTSCPNNPRGIYGSPHAVQDAEGDACNTTSGACSTSPQMEDRIPTTFEATNWPDLQLRLSTSYSPSGHSIDVDNLSMGNITVPTLTCKCTNTGNFTLSTGTTSASPGTPASTTICSGVPNIAACTSLEFTNSTGTLTISGIPASVENVVSNKNVSITGSLTDKNIYTVNSATISVSDRLTRVKLVSQNGNITIASGAINNSIIVTTGNDSDISFDSGTISNSTILTKDTFWVDNTANVPILTNNKVFSKSSDFKKGIGDTSGGLFYSKLDTKFIRGTGNTVIGTCSSITHSGCGTPCNPVLMIIGGDLILSGGGTVDIIGVVFINGNIDYEGSGGFAITGTVVSNATTGSSTFSARGNANIRFNSCVINTLKDGGHAIVRRPECGSAGGARGPYILNTKVTIY